MHTMVPKSGLRTTLLSIILTLVITVCTGAFNDYHHSDKIFLSDVKALLLHQGQMTTARRSAPVPQLKCVGGAAQYKFTPKVVQCINQGSDGYDIQWECKTDMDNAYRFGHVEVTCEGYDYPNDPYILKGSCGLEYTLEFTEEGLQREKQKGGYSHSYHYGQKSEGGVSGLFVFGAILVAIYVIYKTCLAPNAHNAQHRSQADQQPPPYGFRPEYMPGQGPSPSAPPPPYDDSWGNPDPHCGDNFYSHQQHHRTYPNTASMGPGGGGFWSGAATGGLMGYLFGRGTGNNYNRGYGWGSEPHFNRGNNSGGFFSSSSSSSSGYGSGSSGTRTASGFGGTSRR